MDASVPSTVNLSHLERDLLYRLVARHIPNTALFLLDHHLRILVAEGQALQDRGYTTQSLEGQLITDVLTPPNVTELIAQYHEALQGVDNQREYHWDYSSYQIHVIPVRDKNKQVAHLMVVAINITEQVKAQQTIVDAENRTHALLSALPDAMFVINREGIVTEFQLNDGISFLFLEDSVGKHLSQIGMAEGNSQLTLIALDDAFATRRTQSFEFTMHNQGDDYYLEARTLAVNDNEAITLVRDISELRRAVKGLTERNYELEILRSFDQDLNQVLSVDYVLKRAIEYLQANSDASCGVILLLRGEHLESGIVRGTSDQQVQAFLKKCKKMLHQTLQRHDAQLITDFGDYSSLMSGSKAAVLLPIFTGDKPLGMVILETATSFTRRHLDSMNQMINRLATGLENARLHNQTEQQLIELQTLYAKVHKLEQIKTDMIRIASHDLKNPLTGMSGYIELLRWEATQTLNDEQKNYLTEIAKANSRMQHMVNSILSLDRIEQLADNSLNEQVNIGQVAERVVNEQRYNAKQKSHTIAVHLLTDKTIVSGDLYQLQEAMINLLTNAIKYTPIGGNIIVTVQGQEDEVEFMVRDTGFGIPEVMQQRLFTPFFRAKTKDTEAIEGTGLGLHLVKNIVERHHGRMIFHSESGKGSTFGFALPLVASL